MRLFPLALVAFPIVTSIVHAGHLHRFHRRYQRNGYRLDLKKVGTLGTISSTIETVPLPSNVDNHDNNVSRSTSNNTTSDGSGIFQLTDLQACLSHLTTWINNWIANTTASDIPLSQDSVTKVASVLQEHQENLKGFITTAETNASVATGLKLVGLQGLLVGFGDWIAAWIALAKANGTSSQDAIANLQQDVKQHENDVSDWLSQANSPVSINSIRRGGVTVSVAPLTSHTTTMASMTGMGSSSTARTYDDVYSSFGPSLVPRAVASTLPTLRRMHARFMNLTVSIVPAGGEKQPGIVPGCK